MAVLPILIAPHPTLKAKAKPVKDVTDELRALLDDMLETMYDAPGIGLAANQIGSLHRVLVMDCGSRDDEETPRPIKIINPEITGVSEELSSYEEGCLSIPEQFADVERPAVVRVKYLDETGQKQERLFDGLEATCVQHEIDHLDGVLFVDHLSNLKRNMLMKKLKKYLKDREEDAADVG
ncbi:peptide deformylase [Alphaproteobacteria bacterium]|jgi:peptide deformylase|nr:peptide deformylase [Alphaproteobacteria bacterium]MDG1415757.1 peptide deformylase [Alphaproteobacteria bacterium]